MRKKHSLVLVSILAICLIMLVGCSSSGGNGQGSAPVPEAKVLTFSKMKVKTSTRTGFFGGRYASFEVTGSVTNKTDNPINKDNVPSIVWDDGSGSKVKVDMSQEKLLSGETCDVSWEKEITIDGSSIPELSFDGAVEFTGLDGCQEELNGQLQAIAGEYAAQDSAKEEERKAKEQAKADEAKKKEDTKSSLNACKGKTAYESYNIAKGTDYPPIFKDSYDVDVTDDVKKAASDSKLGQALVSAVEINEGNWFSDRSVIFMLDYTDPAAQKERDDKAAADKARAQADKDILTCKGKTADEAFEIASRSSYKPRFIDSFEVDVTDDVRDDSNGSEVHTAKVNKVETDEGSWFSDATVTFALDYTDPEAKVKREKEEAEEAARAQAEKEKQEAEEQLKRSIEDCKGKTVLEAYKLVKDSGYGYKFILSSDSGYERYGYGEDITDEVKDKLYKGARRRTKITNVSIKGNDITFTVERHLSITVDDNEDLRALLQLHDDFDESISTFAKKYSGKNIEFDGCFSDVYAENKGKDYPIYRYSVLIGAMDYDPDKAIGPNFHVSDLRLDQFNWVGDQPNTIETGQNVHMMVRLGVFNSNNGLYELTPIETRLR